MSAAETAGPIQVKIVNERGLHARASAKFVKLTETFDALVQVEKDGSSVGGTSIMGLMMLAASKGCSIQITATGTQRTEALKALEKLVANKFGEEC